MTVVMEEKHQDYQVITVNEQRYALPVANLVRVVPLRQILHLPGTPGWLLGVVHVHNAIVPVIELNAMLDSLSSEAYSAELPLLVLIHHPDDHHRYLAVAATDLTDLIDDSELAGTHSTIHPVLLDITEQNQQKLHWLDDNRLFDYLLRESQ